MRRFTTSLATALALTLLTLAPASATAAAPTISGTTVSEVTSSSATLEAKVNPGNKANTKYRFEYGTEDCASSPCGSTLQGTLEKGEADVPVEAGIEGLQAGTTYHFRVVAKNSDGETPGPDSVFTTQLPPQVFGPCSANDAFRTDKPSAKLPDCRAYEQASPVNKNGVDVGGKVAFLKASPSGDAVSFMTLTGIPGGAGGQEIPLYLARRDPFGWSTQGLLPPQGFGEEAFIRGWTPDFSQVFSTADNLSDQNDGTLISRSADGSHTTIVPYGSGLTGANYVGASADGSKVLFESKGKLPGTEAIVGKPNIYLWDKESDEVKLAGVSNDGSVPEQGVSAGQGSGTYTQDTHAVSTDGSVSFTDAKSGQLYLRRNPAEEQSAVVLNEGGEEDCTEPAKACTIHLSATRKKNGNGPGKSDAAGTRAATFASATPDGSKIFFTSPEKLTNDANTGPEPTGLPAIVRADIDGTEVDKGFLPLHAKGITVFGGYIYWTNPEAHAIGRAKLNEGAATDPDPEFILPGPTEAETYPQSKPGLIESGPSVPQYVAVDSEYVYWSNTGPLGNNQFEEQKEPVDKAGTIGRAKLNGEDATEINPEFITGASNPQGVAVDAEHLYWANAAFSAGNNCTEIHPPICQVVEPSLRTIGRADRSGTGVDQLFLTSRQCMIPWGVAVTATNIFSTERCESNGGPGEVHRYDLDGNAVGTLGDENPLPANLRGIATDAGHVYWARSAGDAIGRNELEFSGFNPEEPEFISDAGHPDGLAVDAEHIYWVANQEVTPNPGNDLYRYNTKSGDLTDIAVDTDDENGADVQGVLGASVDGSYVYFAANGDLDGEAGPATPGNCQWSVGNDLDSSGQCDLYLAHEGTIEFIARLDADGGSPEGSDALNWLPRGVAGQLNKTSRVAPDGQTLLFSSKSKLTAYENEGKTELYRYRVGEPGLNCVTCNPTGEPPRGKGAFSNGTSDIGWGLGNINFPALAPSAQPAFILSRNLSADGNKVFFESTEALVSTDLNGVPANPGEDGCPFSTIDDTNHFRYPICKDVYEWEAQGTGSCTAAQAHDGGCLYLLSSGTSDQPSFFLDASTDGSNAFLITRSPLVGQDGDQLYDVYDARVGGGLKSQNQSPPVPCENEGCKPELSTPPQSQSAGTASFAGPASPKPALHRKAKKAKKAKKRGHKRQHHGRRANHDRKAGR
jgi:WD40-like Beta Propeller Repeat